MNTENAGISLQMIDAFRAEFDADPVNSLMQNAVTNNKLDDIALNRKVVSSLAHSFSIRLDDWRVTHQKSSGRCWMFAGLNLFRHGAMKKMNLKEFEFSQNYTLFWDKFERSNFLLEAIIETAQNDIDDRTVAFLLDRPLDDGGQWSMFVSLIKKHGVVPKCVMPESISSSATMLMNSMLHTKLREFAMQLRDSAAAGKSLSDLRAQKADMLGIIFRILSIHLGTPPAKFDWQWTDKDNNFHRDGVLTPQDFAAMYITIPFEDYICLVHDPRPTSPYGRTFTVKHLGNIVGGDPIKYLNVPIETMKQIAMQILQDGEPVWFGCDVGKMMHSKEGLWDSDLYAYDKVYGTKFGLDKASRLLYHSTLMTHAMLFTGVDVFEGKPRRWRVENSWGDEVGQKGFYTMADNWFDEYMFEIAARKSYLSPDMLKALQLDPIVLPPWDPMGSLAR